MSNENRVYGEIEIGLHQVLPEDIEVELRITDPETQGEIAPARGQARISPEKLMEELLALQTSPRKYGEALTPTYLRPRRFANFTTTPRRRLKAAA